MQPSIKPSWRLRHSVETVGSAGVPWFSRDLDKAAPFLVHFDRFPLQGSPQFRFFSSIIQGCLHFPNFPHFKVALDITFSCSANFGTSKLSTLRVSRSLSFELVLCMFGWKMLQGWLVSRNVRDVDWAGSPQKFHTESLPFAI